MLKLYRQALRVAGRALMQSRCKLSMKQEYIIAILKNKYIACYLVFPLNGKKKHKNKWQQLIQKKLGLKNIIIHEDSNQQEKRKMQEIATYLIFCLYHSIQPLLFSITALNFHLFSY